MCASGKVLLMSTFNPRWSTRSAFVTALDLIEGQWQSGNAMSCRPPVRAPLKVIHQPI
jgi:hypothetical protein